MFNWIKPKTLSPDPAGESAPHRDKAGVSKKDQLISEAMGHARTAREAIGEETLSKVRELMQRQQQSLKTPEQKAKEALKSLAPERAAESEISPMEQAKKILLSMEPTRLADHLRQLREYDKTN